VRLEHLLSGDVPFTWSGFFFLGVGTFSAPFIPVPFSGFPAGLLAPVFPCRRPGLFSPVSLDFPGYLFLLFSLLVFLVLVYVSIHGARALLAPRPASSQSHSSVG
jgi:hypothetical protein